MVKTSSMLDKTIENHAQRQRWLIKEKEITQPAFTCSKLTIQTLEQGVKHVQS